jgi:type IV secretion system protein VirB10
MTDALHAEATPSPVPPKEDPETLVLRGRPRPVVRFRRGLIIAVTGVVTASLVAVTWAALEPPSFRFAAGEEPGEPLRKAPPEALADAPASYGDVPKLGPPLPGDLGRPILDHQRSLETAGDPASQAGRAEAAAEAEQQRVAAAEQAARASGVMVQLTGGKAPADNVPPPVGPEPAREDLASAATAPVASAGGQQRKIDFAKSGDGDLDSHVVLPAPSPWTLSAGTIIPASLITGLNSDLPGLVIAQVSQNVSDTATGRTVLIPQGARLIGSYDSMVAYGQRRALLVWQRIVFPDGSSIALDKMPATDTAGYSGLMDRVDSHSWQLIKGIALSTLLGVGTELSLGSSESDLVRAVRESAQQNAAHAGDQITSRNLDVQPTLTVRPGWPVRAIVQKDLILKPWKG